jgi:hypothetical protein
MSYLNPPRLTFAGKFEANVSTVNNDPIHFDNSKFLPEYQKLTDASGWNGWFNPRGDAAFKLIGCQITGATGPSGAPVGADPVFECALADSDRMAPAKLVDLDPEQQLVSTIFGLEVRVCDQNGTNLLRGTFEPAPFTDIWDRATGPGSDTNAGSMYQSVITDIGWADVSHSPFLTALREAAAAADGLLSIKFNVDGFNMDFGGPDFMRGRIVGAIGAARAGEPRHFVAGRQFVALPGPNPNFYIPKGGINFCTAIVDEDAGKVIVDLGNALPTVDPGGAILPSSTLGRLALGYIDAATSAPKLLGEIQYSHAGWYERTGGIAAVPARGKLSAQQLAAVAGSPLVLVLVTDPAKPPVVAIQEAGSGLHVRADNFVHRLDPGEQAHVTIHATRFGKPLAGAGITAIRDLSGMQTRLAPGADPPGSVAPAVGKPAAGIAFDSHVQTGTDGTATLTITAGDPQRFRVYIDGQLYGVRPALEGVPTTDPPANPWDFISLLVFDGFEPDEPLAWHGTPTGSLKPIFEQYANLYPVMYTFLDLADYEDVCRHRELLLLAFRLAEKDPNTMPVTRDLSGSKRAAVIRWLDPVGDDGKPLLGTPTPVVEAAAAPAEAATPGAGTMEEVSPVADLSSRGGKLAALARRNSPVTEPAPRASA